MKKIYGLIIITIVCFVSYYFLTMPIGLRMFYENQNKCSAILHKNCCGYKNYFGIVKIEPEYDYCQAFNNGYAKVRIDYRYKGYTADEWEWFASHPQNPFITQSGDVIPKPNPSNKKTGCINKFGEPVDIEYCSPQYTNNR